MSAGGAPARPPAPPNVSWRLVMVPTEHGGWAFLAEPVLLGLLVAPSWSGALLAAAALAAFVARQPLRLLLADRRRGRRYPRTAMAERGFAACALAAAAALAGAFALGDRRLALGLAAIAPLAAAALAFDLGRRSRAVAAEVAAALALAGLATAIALAGGRPTAHAFALWAALAGRVIPTIVYVRARLRLDRGEPAPVAAAIAGAAAAIGLASLLVAAGLIHPFAVPAMILLLVRAAWFLSPLRPRLATAGLGVTEIAFGLVTVLAIAGGKPGG